MPAPSPHAVPSAAAEKALQRPSAERPRWRLKSRKVSGVAITVTPPARASSHSPLRSACTARCRATSEDEQAVSTETAGPSSPKVYESRPASTLAEVPVPRWPSSSSGEFIRSAR